MTRTAAQRTPADSAPAGLRMGSWLMGPSAVGFIGVPLRGPPAHCGGRLRARACGALPAHYPNHFDTLGHLGPIYLATGIFVVGALVALPGIIAQRRS
jgi:hypothetical protein